MNIQTRTDAMDHLLFILSGTKNSNLTDDPYVRRAARRLLVNAARHIVGGYANGTPEDAACEMLLRIAEEIPL